MSTGNLKVFVVLSAILGVISFLWLLLDYLALTDIWQGGESNLDHEWVVVAISFVPIIFFHLCVFLTLILVFKSIKKKEAS